MVDNKDNEDYSQVAQDNQDKKGIDEIEKELLQLVSNDKKRWIRIYKLMDMVEKKQLFKPKFRSFTSWLDTFATNANVHVSMLWSRKKAGKYYDDYISRQKEKGITVKPIDELSVSPDNIVIAERIAGSNTDVGDELIEKVVSGQIGRSDLREAWNTVKAERVKAGMNPHRTNAHDKTFDTVDDGKNGDTLVKKKNITATDIVFALISDTSWIGSEIEKNYCANKYRVFTEFSVNTGTTRNARRIDALAIETMTTSQKTEINIHAVEIKVSKSDLLNDTKMAEYCDFCDYFWIAVPERLVENVKDVAVSSWGILAVSDVSNDFNETSNDGSDSVGNNKSKSTITVIRRAKKIDAVFRDVTITSALIKLL